jgi:[ribosomal protein S5]-alanine N-acetyltransferase
MSLHFTPFPLLTTSRFILRPLTPDDAPYIFVLRTDDSVNQFLDRPKANCIEDVHEFINKITDGISKDESILWAIEFKDTPGLTGTVCLWNISWEDARAEIGYELLPQHQGKGIMQEVIPVVLKYGFEVIGLWLIMAELTMENVRSVRLLEKHGFVRDTAVTENEGLAFYRLEK